MYWKEVLKENYLEKNLKNYGRVKMLKKNRKENRVKRKNL